MPRSQLTELEAAEMQGLAPVPSGPAPWRPTETVPLNIPYYGLCKLVFTRNSLVSATVHIAGFSDNLITSVPMRAKIEDAIGKWLNEDAADGFPKPTQLDAPQMGVTMYTAAGRHSIAVDALTPGTINMNEPTHGTTVSSAQIATALGRTAPTVDVPVQPSMPATIGQGEPAPVKGQGPRVTIEDIEKKIVTEQYINAGQAALAMGAPVHPSLEALTICILVMENGFAVVGKTAPVSPANYDQALGHKYAREDAIRQLWPLEGYALREKGV